MSNGSVKAAEKTRRVLVVDDEQSIGMGILKMLGQSGHYYAIHAPNGEQAQGALSKEAFDLVITDIRMPGLNGIDLLKYVRSHHPHTGVIVMTAYGSTEVQEEASRRGSLYYIEKPFDLNRLDSIIDDFFRKHEISAETTPSGSQTDVQGIIPGLQLMDVVQMNCLSRMTCTLHIKNTDQNKQGIICFKKGAITHAETHTPTGVYAGKDAFFEIASWKGGSFDTITEVPPTVTIAESWEQLLIESMQQMPDEDTSPADAGNDSVAKIKVAAPAQPVKEETSSDTTNMLDRIMSSANADAVFIITTDGFTIDKRLKPDTIDLQKLSEELSKTMPAVLSVGKTIQAGKLKETTFRFQEKLLMIRSVENSDLLIAVVSPSHVPSGDMYRAIERESENLKKIL
ncbi:MAG: response regulator [Chlorobiales bacterium]|nr:response regulator [Chlorobiales bacterium]